VLPRHGVGGRPAPGGEPPPVDWHAVNRQIDQPISQHLLDAPKRPGPVSLEHVTLDQQVGLIRAPELIEQFHFR
jgi:hypothetical protein